MFISIAYLYCLTVVLFQTSHLGILPFWVDFIIWQEKRVLFLYFHMNIQFSKYYLLKDFPLLSILGDFVKNKLTRNNYLFLDLVVSWQIACCCAGAMLFTSLSIHSTLWNQIKSLGLFFLLMIYLGVWKLL